MIRRTYTWFRGKNYDLFKVGKYPFPVFQARNEAVVAALGVGSACVITALYMLKALVNRSRPAATVQTSGPKVVVVGGGVGGATVASMLTQHDPDLEVTVLDSRRQQQFTAATPWALAGHRSYDLCSHGPNSLLAPTGWTVTREAKLITSSAQKFIPSKNLVIDEDGGEHPYDMLVLAMGCEWTVENIKGLKPEDLNKNRVIVDAGDVRDNIADLHFGKLFFARCGRTTQTRPCEGYWLGGLNVLWKFLNYFDRLGRSHVHFIGLTPDNTISDYLPTECRKEVENWMIQSRKIDVWTNHTLVAVDPKRRKLTLKGPDGLETHDFALLVLEPEVSAPAALRFSPLASTKSGFAEVDPKTLQHKKYPNVFAVGDCADLPTGRSAAATLTQSHVAVHNIIRYMEKKPLNGVYDGYTSFPIVMSTWLTMWPQYDYSGKIRKSWLWDSVSWWSLGGFVKASLIQLSVHEFFHWSLFLRGWYYPPRWILPASFPEGTTNPNSDQFNSAVEVKH
eukprot:PhF_6_TR29078/c0_g1_i1/m.42386/K17218/sqr; sulfide:quinone oxidoreductase